MADVLEIKKEFIRQSLNRGGQLMLGDMVKSINKLDLIDSQQLIGNIRFKVDTGSQDYDGRLSFSFPRHGRFQDMGAGRSSTDQMMDELSFLGKPRRSIKRVPRKWYTRNVYGNLNTIINSLMHGYTEEAKAAIKKQLEQTYAV